MKACPYDTTKTAPLNLGTVSPVPDIDILGSWDKRDAIHHGAEGTKLILMMNRLKQRIHVQVPVKIEQTVHVDTV